MPRCVAEEETFVAWLDLIKQVVKGTKVGFSWRGTYYLLPYFSTLGALIGTR